MTVRESELGSVNKSLHSNFLQHNVYSLLLLLWFTPMMCMTQSFSAFFLFSIAFCKDSWEDFTDLVEQMQMLDEFKGAYGGITLPSPPHPRLGHHPKTIAGMAVQPCLYQTSLPEQYIRTTASIALPLVLMFFCCSLYLSLFHCLLSPFLLV